MHKKAYSILLIMILVIFPINKVLANEIGSFTELQDLVNSNYGKTLTLEKDYKNSGSESEVFITSSIDIDLNGHIINANGKSRIFYVKNGSTLVIADNNSNVTHKFDIDEEKLLATLNEEFGTLTVNGGCITGGLANGSSFHGGAIFVDGSNFILKSGNIIGNKTVSKFGAGAGIYVFAGNVTINGGSVSYNNAIHTWEGAGGGVQAESANVTINGGSISYNKSVYGGGISFSTSGKLEINGGTINGNESYHDGGGVVVAGGSAVMNGGTIKDNKVLGGYIGTGGGIGTRVGATLTINAGKIINNSAPRGGGIGTWTGGTINIYGGEISGNIASEDVDKTDGTSESNGAGVFFYSKFIIYKQTVDASLTIGGTAKITNNLNNNIEDNVYFADGQKITIADGQNAPKEGMKVGVNMKTNGVFTTNGSETDERYFYSDLSKYAVEYENNSLKLTDRIYTYEIIEGDNQKFTKGKVNSYSFKIDGDYALFDTLLIDELELSNGTDYKITRGSTIVKFTSSGIEKLNTLDVGEYSFTAKYTNSKEVVGTLIIEAEKKNEKQDSEKVIKEVDNPKTGDGIILNIVLATISLFNIFICGKYLRK